MFQDGFWKNVGKITNIKFLKNCLKSQNLENKIFEEFDELLLPSIHPSVAAMWCMCTSRDSL